jgi:hypothetical protein
VLRCCGSLGALVHAAHQALARQLATVADPHRFMIAYLRHQLQELTIIRCPYLRAMLAPAVHRRA